MRKKLVLAVFSAIAILALAVSPAFAITGNWVEDNEHPFVGLVTFYDENGDFIWRCSGSLLDPTTFLTAGRWILWATSLRYSMGSLPSVSLTLTVQKKTKE